jgi:beta-mannosidase
MDLGGAWRAAVADDDLRRVYAEPAYDDGDWITVEVPGHWQSTPALADTEGPVLHRRSFATSGLDAGQRAWLEFDGTFYQSDVYLDDTYLGDTEGYFFPHRFEITEQLLDRDQHVLALEVASSPPSDLTAKRSITGVFDHWDAMDPAANAGGIWRPVRIATTGPVRIHHYRCLCSDASPDRATVSLRAVLGVTEPTDIEVCTTLRRPSGETERQQDVHHLAAGENRVEWEISVEDPELWWPHSLGEQSLHHIDIAVREVDGEVSDRRYHRIGLRSFELDDWVATVNGERLYLKGAHQGPARLHLADATREDFRRDVDLAIACGLDFLRVHGHVSRPELYDVADEAGLLLWQDFPLQWGYARQVLKQARRQAREMVDLLAHHPSVAIWCAHDEPVTLDISPDSVVDPLQRTGSLARTVMAQQLPTWNRTRLDTSVRRVITKSDGSRPVIPHSGVFPHPPQLDGTDSHLWYGWYYGDERDLARTLSLIPRLGRFVGAFGAQAVPEDADFCNPERWPDLDWDHLGRRHSLQRTVFDRTVPPDRFATFAEWTEATQRYQATLIRRQVETLRRLKYRPTGGFALFSFADTNPAVSWSVLDHRRRPKRGYAALQAACAPVIVVADRLPGTIWAGQALALDIHVVSDLRHQLDDAEVTARLSWPGGDATFQWGGSIPADECVRVGTLELPAPDSEGTLQLDLELAAGQVTASNRYRGEIRPTP